MGIGLGSLVVSPAGMVMVVAATDGDEMYCVSRDRQIKQWCHRSALKEDWSSAAERLAIH